jgi:hypothetical protein
MNNNERYSNPEAIKKLKKSIENLRKKLIAKVARKGIYENFGVKEVRELKDKFSDYSDYIDMNQRQEIIQEFSNWCGWYNG